LGTRGETKVRVRPVSIAEFDKLGIDENNKLYLDGKPIVVDERVSLQWWLNIAAVAAALSTVVMAVIEVLRFCAGS
jgi:hypothetical protein